MGRRGNKAKYEMNEFLLPTDTIYLRVSRHCIPYMCWLSYFSTHPVVVVLVVAVAKQQ